VVYLDACALVKHYIDEGDGGSAVMDGLIANADKWGGLFSSELLIPEVASAFAKKFRSKVIDGRELRRLLRTFRFDAIGGITLIGIAPNTMAEASVMLESVADVRCHAGDAIHLYTAETLKFNGSEPLAIATADNGLIAAATRRGLWTFDPRVQSLADLNDFFGR
jgi:predicted nucleic acid-binding protein